MAFENYQTWSWAVYALSAVLVMLVTLRMTRNWYTGVKAFLRVTLLITMAVPWYVSGTQGTMAPAFAIAAFEGLTLEGNQWMRAGLPLMAALTLGYFIMVIGLWIARSQQAKRGADDSTDQPGQNSTEPHPAKERTEPGI